MFRLRITGDLGFEFWQDIPGYEGLYQASTCGRIKSLPNKNRKNQFIDGRILSIWHNKLGYGSVSLTKTSGHNLTQRVHRLIAKTFIPNPNKYPVINHKDEHPENNNVGNIEWCTISYNRLYGEGYKKCIDNRTGKTARKKIIQLSQDGEILNYFDSVTDAGTYIKNMFGVKAKNAKVNIGRCCLNKYGYKTSYGFKWEYAVK